MSHVCWRAVPPRALAIWFAAALVPACSDDRRVLTLPAEIDWSAVVSFDRSGALLRSSRFHSGAEAFEVDPSDGELTLALGWSQRDLDAYASPAPAELASATLRATGGCELPLASRFTERLDTAPGALPPLAPLVPTWLDARCADLGLHQIRIGDPVSCTRVFRSPSLCAPARPDCPGKSGSVRLRPDGSACVALDDGGGCTIEPGAASCSTPGGGPQIEVFSPTETIELEELRTPIADRPLSGVSIGDRLHLLMPDARVLTLDAGSLATVHSATVATELRHLERNPAAPRGLLALESGARGVAITAYNERLERSGGLTLPDTVDFEVQAWAVLDASRELLLAIGRWPTDPGRLLRVDLTSMSARAELSLPRWIYRIHALPGGRIALELTGDPDCLHLFGADLQPATPDTLCATLVGIDTSVYHAPSRTFVGSGKTTFTGMVFVSEDGLTRTAHAYEEVTVRGAHPVPWGGDRIAVVVEISRGVRALELVDPAAARPTSLASAPILLGPEDSILAAGNGSLYTFTRGELVRLRRR